MAKIYTYTVSGASPFPLDMLRYDSAWPLDPDKIHHNLAKLPGDPRARQEIRIASARRPTNDRWSSFGWHVDLASIRTL